MPNYKQQLNQKCEYTMNNLQKLRELTKSLDFQEMIINENGSAPRIPTKDPDIFATVIGTIKTEGEARVAIVDFPTLLIKFT